MTRDPTTMLSGKRLLLFLSVQQVFWCTTTLTFAQITVAQNTDDCPITNDLFQQQEQCDYVFDGVCDAGTICPTGTDCFDCHGCAAYHLNCTSCIDNGCFWCPSDATCQSQSLGNVWTTIQQHFATAKVSSCEADDSWVQTCATNPENIFTDPLYSAQQWAYQMMNVEPVWAAGYTGKGVVVRVNDPNGVDVTHPELALNFEASASCSSYLPASPEDSHGTAVASLAVGVANNSHCAAGIAPNATLSACVGPSTKSDEDVARFFDNGLDSTHISVNSWGFDACSKKNNNNARRRLQTTCPFVADNNPCNQCADWTSSDCEAEIVTFCTEHYETEMLGCAEYLDLFITCGYNVLSDVGQEAITKGVQQGRDGKGIIYVFAAGNELDMAEDVNMEGWLNSRFTITVGAVGKDGLHASYSTPGSALFISGPGGDFNDATSNIVAAPGGGCVDATVGTSFATPSVAGAIALVLEANPMLGWRDVQSILAATARKIDEDNPSWTTNGALVHHSNLYGFGTMDARAAVEVAKTWINVGPERQIMMESGEIGVAIVDNPSSPAEWALFVNGTGSFSVESVVVYLQLEHESRGDLEITLMSPSGTESVLHPGSRPENRHLIGEERWKLMTVRNFGEYPVGVWTIAVTDRRPGNLGDCVNLDFAFSLTENGETFVVNCGTIESSASCANGSVVDSEVDNVVDLSTGRTGREACCSCGGGRAASTVNELLSWRLVIYGHGDFIEGDGLGSGGSRCHQDNRGLVLMSLGLVSLVSLASLLHGV
ncbi:Furin-like protease 1, isoform 1 [Seminavis robusta]|uniref:subtilisin n=1 Tax=Seminavis robusta TaxID=568900 RepID=A0A9N8E9J6_9STRA|nr:Furin-like protease 1, isoform 1 [Seminavis robusta]|eukprot:Sro658_g182760.1 Furin-like protease 1, isoform 1 (772) ;mRNA; f:33376-36315